MKASILLLLLAFLSFSAISQEKLQFTPSEFKKALDEDFAKRMKKVGRSKLIDFSNELLKKEEELANKEEALKKREEQLKVNEGELKKRYEEFNNEQKNFLSCLDKEDQKVQRRVQHMVDVVSGMKPQTAANLLSQQDPSLSIKILGMLEATKVSKIFNLMDKEISAKLQKQYMTLKK